MPPTTPTVFPPPDKRIRPPEPRIPSPAVPSLKALTPFGEFIAALVRTINPSRIQTHVTALAGFPTRHSHAPENDAAAAWIRARFRDSGYSDVTYHDFTVDGFTRHNVVCTKPGVTLPAQFLVVCGHYDSRSSNLSDAAAAAPGADDNASGIAAVLEVARALRAIDTTWSVRMIAFSGEEQGLVGSAAYAAMADGSGVQIPLLVNLDMVGHPVGGGAPSIVIERDMGNVVGTNDAASQAFATQMVQVVADHTAIGSSLGPIYSSDYMPFEARGYVCIGAFDGADSEPFYHASSDTVDKVDISFCTEVARAVLGTVVDVAGKRLGAALVYDPDPITASGDTTLTPASGGLDLIRRPVSLQALSAPDATGLYRLDGPACGVIELEAPVTPASTTPQGVFVYSHTDSGFGDVMAYYHVDRLRRQVQGLGVPTAVPPRLDVDAHGATSHFDPVSGSIALAAGPAPADAEDAGVILHQYAHAVLASLNPGFTSTEGLGSGFADLVPALAHDTLHANPGVTRGMTAPWAGSGRRYDRPWTFDDPSIVGDPARGERWASTLFELYRELGGDSSWPSLRIFARDLVLRLHVAATMSVPANGATPEQLAQELEAADDNLGGWGGLADGLHRKVITDVFERRQLNNYPPRAVDVYIDDGRDGGYAWLENYWETQDIWTRPSPYTAAQLATASPADHQEPTVAAPAYLYVRLRNRGTLAAGSGPVTVRAFHCMPGAGLEWPTSWTPMSTPSLSVPNVLSGAANAVIVGPFDWTPTIVGHECVLVIAECAKDPAVTQTLGPADTVEHSVLVPFDNNIAQRNLVPVSAKTVSRQGFYVRNPFTRRVEVELSVETTSARGWTVLTQPGAGSAISLEPRAQRWIDVSITPPRDRDADGERTAHVTRVVALLDGRPIGGMTFATPSREIELPPESRGETSEVAAGAEVFSLAIPWDDCEVEGTVVVHARVRTR